MAWYDGVFSRRQRDVKVTKIPVASSVNFPGDTTRVRIRLLWNFPASVEAPAAGSQGECLLTIPRADVFGVVSPWAQMAITQNWQIDEMGFEDFGYLVQQQFTVSNESPTVDAILIEVLLR